MGAAGDMELLGKGQRTLLLLTEKAVADTLFLCHFFPMFPKLCKGPIVFVCIPCARHYQRGTQKLILLL